MSSARAVLDLPAFAHNLARLRERAPHSRVMAVVKANAYGHGLVRTARALADVDAFAVARAEEGVILREAGIRQRIVVLQGFLHAEELRMNARHGLEPVVHSLYQLGILERTKLDRPLGVWLKFDTGMHRLGLNEEEFRKARARLADLPGIRQPVPVMTHLANADVLEDPATARQLRRFHAAVPATVERAIANSAGLLAWDGSHAEWVRPGIALYGVSPFPARTGSEEGLRPVMTLQTRIIAIKELQRGDAVGYGGEFVCRRPTRAGVAAIGYGDGYPRNVPTGTPVLVRGQRVPLIGRVSMDLISLDLTDCLEAEVADTVTLWGNGLPVEEIARWAGTIPYVLLCNITQRVDPVEIHSP